MRNAVLIFNPAAGKHRADEQASRLAATLARSGFDTEPRATQAPGDATTIARAAAQEGVDVVFALGGDGTLREAATGLIGSEVALGFLPTGTANVMIYALGIPARAELVAACAERLEPIRVDVGRWNEEPFLMMASVGIDGAALTCVRPALKRRFGKLGVGIAGLEAWWRYGYPQMRVEVASRTIEASLVVASNIAFYGGSFRIAPEARLDDGKLDLVAFRGRGRLATLGFARDLALGRHLGRADTEYLTTDTLRIIPPLSTVGQIDGDARTLAGPVDIGVDKGALRILADPSVVGR